MINHIKNFTIGALMGTIITAALFLPLVYDLGAY
jgi:hypothetical protein